MTTTSPDVHMERAIQTDCYAVHAQGQGFHAELLKLGILIGEKGLSDRVINLL